VSTTDLEKTVEGMAPLAQEVSRALEGAVYPLEPSRVVWVARENEAPPTLLSLLSVLRRTRYLSLAEVQEDLDGV
jgi:hypothetical protein